MYDKEGKLTPFGTLGNGQASQRQIHRSAGYEV